MVSCLMGDSTALASAIVRCCLKSYGIRQSMSRKGDPYDNAVAENFSAVSCAS